MSYKEIIFPKQSKEERLTIIPQNKRKDPNLFFVQKEHLFDFVKSRLSRMMPFFKESLEIEEFLPVNSICEKSSFFFGMIYKLDKEKLSNKNVFLFNNIDESNSVPVKLDFKHLNHFSIFPGQVVVVKGKNVSGSEIIVERIDCISDLDTNNAEKNCLPGKKPLEIISCSGPFYDEINEFGVLEKVLSFDSDLLILHGPLLKFDFNHKNLDPISFCENEFLSKLEDWLKRDSSSKIIIIPSMEDLLCKNVFPQSAYKFKETNKRLLFFTNPSSFFVNGFLFSTTTADILLNISAEEYYENDSNPITDPSTLFLFEDDDRAKRLCYHLLFQQTFLPTFPANFPVSFSCPSDLKNELSPDFFIISSKVNEFVKLIPPCRVINVGVQSDLKYKVYAKIVIKDEENIEAEILNFSK